MTYTHSIFDSAFNGMGGGEYYRAQTIPELYPSHQTPPKPRFENWDPEELKIYCGGEFGVRGV